MIIVLVVAISRMSLAFGSCSTLVACWQSTIRVDTVIIILFVVRKKLQGVKLIMVEGQRGRRSDDGGRGIRLLERFGRRGRGFEAAEERRLYKDVSGIVPLPGASAVKSGLPSLLLLILRSLLLLLHGTIIVTDRMMICLKWKTKTLRMSRGGKRL
jgi:hypothetical protein